MRSAILCLLCLGSFLGAYEEPTIIDSPNDQSQRLLTFDSTTGMIRLYWKLGDRGANSLELKSRHNFIYDLQQLTRVTKTYGNPIYKLADDQPEEVDYPKLQLGENNVRSWAEFFSKNYFDAKKPDQDTDSPFVQAVRTEMEFWKEEPKYDGRAYAAMSQGYIMVYVPSSYAVLLYWLKNDEIILTAYRSIRPEMLLKITDGFKFNSYPKFNDMKSKIRQLTGGAAALAERMAAIDEAMAAMETDLQIIPVAKSDPFVAGLSNDRFVILDVGNKRLMVYQFTRALELISLRNLELDFLMPSWPLPNKDLDQVAKYQVDTYMKALRKNRMNGEIDTVAADILKWAANKPFKWAKPDDQSVQLDIFRQLSVVKDELLSAGGGKKKPWDAAIIQSPQRQSPQLLFDHKGLRRLFVYDLSGQGGQIELMSAQSYDIDTAMEDYSARLRRILVIKDFFEDTQSKAHVRPYAAWIMKRVEYILKASPEYCEVIAKDSKFQRWQQNLELWDREHPADQLVVKYQTLMEGAMAQVEENKARWVKLTELVQEAMMKREDALQAADDRKNQREPSPPMTRDVKGPPAPGDGAAPGALPKTQ